VCVSLRGADEDGETTGETIMAFFKREEPLYQALRMLTGKGRCGLAVVRRFANRYCPHELVCLTDGKCMDCGLQIQIGRRRR